MDSFLPRFKNILVLVGLLLLQAIGLAVQIRRPVEQGAPDSRNVLLLRSWVVGLVSPLERLLDFSGHGAGSAWSHYVDLRHTSRENDDLRREIANLRLRQAALAEDALEGQRLQALLTFQQHYISQTVAARVVGASGSDLSRVLYLNKGWADGLRPDMPVITPEGIVGKIRDVFPGTAPHTAQVLLINDQTSGAGVILANTRIRAIVHGTTSGEIRINNLTPDDRIKPGEAVITSGGDQVFPRGLPVGTIESIALDPAHQPYTAIHVKPAVNLFQIEDVLVITGTDAKLPAEVQHELTTDAANSAAARVAAQKAATEAAAAQQAAQQRKDNEARTAAEIVADRLPGATPPLGQAAGASAPNGSATEPGGAVPRPLPTVHPDRYSPGAAPPAADLTPGAAHTPTTPRSTPPGFSDLPR